MLGLCIAMHIYEEDIIMKKQVIALLTAAMLAGAMAGCGSGGADATNSGS